MGWKQNPLLQGDLTNSEPTMLMVSDSEKNTEYLIYISIKMNSSEINSHPKQWYFITMIHRSCHKDVLLTDCRNVTNLFQQ